MNRCVIIEIEWEMAMVVEVPVLITILTPKRGWLASASRARVRLLTTAAR